MRINPRHQRPRQLLLVAVRKAKCRLAIAVVMRRVEIPVEVTVAHHGKRLHRVRAFAHAQDHATVFALKTAGQGIREKGQAEPGEQDGWQETGGDD